MGGEGIGEKILKLLSRHDYGLTIEDVARSLEINRMTASKYLAILEATKQIAVREVGKAKLHYPKIGKNQKWLKPNNYKSSCGLNSLGFIFILFLFLTTTLFFVTITTANSSEDIQNFEISFVKNYPDKLVILEIHGPPLTDFSLTLINPENRSISPKENVSFRTDQEGGYELQLIGFVPGNYLVILESNGTEYIEDFGIDPFFETECNRSFLEYRIENITNVTETNESVAGEYVWDICRDFIESNVTIEEMITEIMENRTFVESENLTNETTNRSFVEEEMNITEITDNRTFLENETVINETLERTFVEQELNITEIAENMTFVERELNVTNITETNESIYDLTTEPIEVLIRTLPGKKRFRMDEKPKFKFTSKNMLLDLITGDIIEENMEPETLTSFVYGPDKKPIDIKTKIKRLGSGEFEIELSKERALRPGLYRIKIEVSKGNETYEKEEQFLWGVLAINTHKSIYLENEEAFIGIAVLDNEGRMVCDADVTLEITDPNGTTTKLTTSDGTINVSQECEVYGVTNLPDYYAYYTVNTEGSYTMTLTATTRDGLRTITDTFEVRKQVDFDVEREGPTRIYPPVKYNMTFTIKANRDYEGEIREYVHSYFIITPQDGLTITTSGDTKILTWSKKLISGETYELTYEFDAPELSPYLFTSGALEIGGWKESREWMIASDAPEGQDLDVDDCSVTANYCPDPLSVLDTVDDPSCSESTCLNIKNGDEYANVSLTAPAFAAGKINEVNVSVRHSGETKIGDTLETSLRDLDTDSTLCSSSITNTESWTTDTFTCSPTPTWAQLDNVELGIVNTDSGQPQDAWVEMVNVSIDYDPPPTWLDPEKNETQIYMNDYVKFNTTWNDTVGLAGYVFSINQGGGWVNSSFVPFTGTGNISENVSQITASANSVVQWRFYANDTGGTWNVTDTQQFTVSNPLRVEDANVTPQQAKNTTSINITANITDLFYSIDTAKAEIYWPNGSFWQNATMTGSGDIYYNETITVSFYPHGTYNVTIWANDTTGNVNSTEKTWFAPYLNLSKEKNITINGSFADWSDVTVVTDDGTDAGTGGGVDNELLITGLSDSGNITVFEWNGSDYLISWTINNSDISGPISGGEMGNISHDDPVDFVMSRTNSSSNYQLEVWSYNTSSDPSNKNWYQVWFNSSEFSAGRPYVGDIGDLDNDTYNEFLVTNENNEQLDVWGNDTADATGFSIEKTVKDCDTNAYMKTVCDMDNDGIPEVVSHCRLETTIEIYEYSPGSGDYELVGTVGAPDGRTAGPIVDDWECGDVDRDSVDEVVFCGNSGRSHVLDYSGGSYSLVYNTSLTPEGNTQTCSIGDLTNDGWPDWFDACRDGTRVFSYNGTGYEEVWSTGDPGYASDPLVGCSFAGDVDNDGFVEFLHPPYASGNTDIWLWENDTVNATGFENTFNFSMGTSNRRVTIIIGDLDGDAGAGGGGGDFDLTNMSLANNDTYLFARIAVNGSIDVSEADKYYRMFISTNDSVGNETSPEDEDLPFKYDYRVQVNGSECYVFNYTDYGDNVSSCLFNGTGAEMEIGVNLTVLGLSAGENANITFQTGSMNPGGYDSAPDGESFLSYDVPGAPGDQSPTASLGTNPVPYLNDSDGSITFDLKCSDDNGVDVLELWGNWSGWHANQTNSSPMNNGWWNVTVNGIPEGTWKWDAWCNDTIGQEDWAEENRTFTVDLTNPQIGSKYINESGSVSPETVVCLNISGVSDTHLDTVWTTVTQSNGSVFNITMSDTGSCAGIEDDGWYSVNVNVGDSSGTFFYNTTYVNDSSGRMNSNTTILNLTVSVTCDVDFTMTTQLSTGIQFAEQDPDQTNVSAVDNGDYNVTDQSTSGCGTVNVSIRATDDLVNETSLIGIGNVTVNSTSPGSETIQLSTSYQLIRSGVPAGTSNKTTLYFWLTIPASQDPRYYNTTIEVKEEME